MESDALEGFQSESRGPTPPPADAEREWPTPVTQHVGAPVGLISPKSTLSMSMENDRRHGFSAAAPGGPGGPVAPESASPAQPASVTPPGGRRSVTPPTRSSTGGHDFWKIVQSSKSDMMTRMIKQKDERIDELTGLLETVQREADDTRVTLERKLSDMNLQFGYLQAQNEQAKTECDVLKERVTWYEDTNEEHLKKMASNVDAHNASQQQLFAANHLLQIRLNHMEDNYFRLKGRYKEFFAHLHMRTKLARSTLDSIRQSVLNEIQVMRHWVGVQSKAIRDKAQVLHMSVNWNLPHDAIVVNAHVQKVVESMNTLLASYRKELGSGVRGESLTALDATPVDYHALCTQRMENAAETQRRRNVVSLSAAVSAPVCELRRRKMDFSLEDTDHVLDGDAFKRLEGYRGAMACLDEVAYRCRVLGKGIAAKKAYQGYRQGRLEVKRQLALQREETTRLLQWFAEHVRPTLTSLRAVGGDMRALCGDQLTNVEAQMLEAWRRQWMHLPQGLTSLNLAGIRIQAEIDVTRRRVQRQRRGGCGGGLDCVRHVTNSPNALEASIQSGGRMVVKSPLIRAAGKDSAWARGSPVDSPLLDATPLPPVPKSPLTPGLASDVASRVGFRSPAPSSRPTPGQPPRRPGRLPQPEVVSKEVQTEKEDPTALCSECRGPLLCLECHDAHRMVTIFPKETLDTLNDLHARLERNEWDKIEMIRAKNALLREMIDFLCFSGRVKSRVGATVTAPDIDGAPSLPVRPRANRHDSNAQQQRLSGQGSDASFEAGGAVPGAVMAPPSTAGSGGGFQSAYPATPVGVLPSRGARAHEGFGVDVGQRGHKPGTAGAALAKLSQHGVKGLTDTTGSPTVAGALVLRNPTVIPLIQQQTQREEVEATFSKLPRRVPHKSQKNPLFEINPYIARCATALADAGAGSLGSLSVPSTRPTTQAAANMTMTSYQPMSWGSGGGRQPAVEARDWVDLLGAAAEADRQEKAAKKQQQQQEATASMGSPRDLGPAVAADVAGPPAGSKDASTSTLRATPHGRLDSGPAQTTAASEIHELDTVVSLWAGGVSDASAGIPLPQPPPQRLPQPPPADERSGSRARGRGPLYVRKARDRVSYQLSDSAVVEKRKKRLMRDTPARRQAAQTRQFSNAMQMLKPRAPSLPRVSPGFPAEPPTADPPEIAPQDMVVWDGTGFAGDDAGTQRMYAAKERREQLAAVPKFPLLHA